MNFNDLYKKIVAIDSSKQLNEEFEKHDFERNNFSSFSTSGTPSAQATGVKECGALGPLGAMPNGMPGMSQPMPQQDSVSMNVSMNAQGKGGIKDLMDVLRQIESGGTEPHALGGAGELLDIEPGDLELDTEPTGDVGLPDIEFDADSEQEIDGHDDLGLDQELGMDVAIDVDGDGDPDKTIKADPIRSAVIGAAKPTAEKIINDKIKSGELGEDHEGYANRPDVVHQGVDYMTKDLSGGLNKQKAMKKHSYRQGDNPMAMSEGLVGQLRNLYQEVKTRK